ncbi:hypothetical protein R1sor_011867 [Riccia sorocarpa]|uniref:Uncharacterized protein n=1 Tax=Riccia sorocarpa TaxID=122646 RepID=A0ABD3I341_9MARC
MNNFNMFDYLNLNGASDNDRVRVVRKWLKARPEGGAALVISSDYTVVDSGIKGSGNVVWAKLRINDEDAGVVSVYASTKSRKRTPLWA